MALCDVGVGVATVCGITSEAVVSEEEEEADDDKVDVPKRSAGKRISCASNGGGDWC